MAISSTDRMIAQREGAIGWITFNNPERRNAVSLAMWDALGAIVRDYVADPAVRVIVVKGAGDKAFVSGADISEFEEKRSASKTIERYNRAAEEATEALERAGKPTIAMVRGYCIGGGVSIALCCDLRIAAGGAKFGVPAAKLGLGYGFQGVRRLVEVVGPSFAKEIFYTARQFTAREAMAMGLVNRVVPDVELETSVRECAGTIATNAPLTVASIKTIVDEVMKDPAKRDLARCKETVKRCFASEDYAEGRRAFMEKRKPLFKGR
jgi:enoyl-CoA hydratase/carnithine racemase